MQHLHDNSYRNNIILNYTFKIVGIILSLIGARVTIAYLGNNIYGLWATIASIVSWMGSGDFGIGNGLRNKYAEAYSEENIDKQNKLLATGMISLSIVALVLFAVVALLTEVLVQLHLIQEIVRIPMYITGLFFCINMVLGIAQSVAYGIQKSWKVSLVNCLSSLFIVIAVLLLDLFNIKANLISFSLVHGICLVVPNGLLILNLERNGIHFLRNNIKSNYSKKLKNEIVNVGILFFGIQICNIILYSTDNLIINYLLNSEMVTKYSVITKVYDTGQNLFSIMLIALWSAVTFHATRNEYGWIRKKLKQLMVIWVVYVLGVVVVSIFINPIIQLWIGENAYYYEPELIIIFAIYAISISFSSIFINIVNGLQKIKLQLIVTIIGAVLNIPLSILFAKYFSLGLVGVKLATLIAILLLDVFMPIQVINLLKTKK